MKPELPRYVLPTATDAGRVLRRLASDGWVTREGFTLPRTPWDVSAQRLVLYGRVPNADVAATAVHAASRGAGVVAIVDPTSAVGRTLTGDLERYGPVYHHPDSPSDDPTSNPIARLVPEQRALLERLANGETIASAAAAEYLSLRTANRRIAQARAVLGVRTTREAVLAYLRQRRGE